MDSNLSKHFGSVRSAHSYDRHVSSSHHTSSSFVTINQKRSWRPSSSLFQPVLDQMANPAPLALAAANPFLRLFVERNVDGGGFTMSDYQVTPNVPRHAACDCSGGGGGGDEVSDCATVDYSGPSRGTSGMVVEEDGVVEAWCDEGCDDASFRDDGSEQRLGASASGARVIPLHISGIGSPHGLSQLSNHCYPAVGVSRVVPSTTQSVSLSLKANAAAGADARDRGCLRECWQGAALELSLCVSITCKSDAALHFATLGAWWLSRYYGVSLRLHHIHPSQLQAFKAVQRALFLKDIHLESCVISEELLQCVSTSPNLLSLSIISCAASQQMTLRCIDSILRKGSETRPGGFHDTHGPQTGGTGAWANWGASESHSPAHGTPTDTARESTNWYLSGVRSLGSLKGLRCLHVLHTPLHESFLEALTTCTSLECLVLHRCRGVRSLEPLQRLKHLQSLSLHGLSVTDADLLSLTGCPQLRQLVLDECRQVKDLSFLVLLRESLERLLIPRTLLSNANMRHIAVCDKLVELHAQSLRQLTDVGALKELTALRVLNLTDNLLTDDGCKALQDMTSLQRLSLASCRCITSLAAVVSASGRWAQRLVSLDLSQTNVTDAGVRYVQQCPDLRFLNLSDCGELTQLYWLQKMSALRWLHLGGTRVSDAETNRYLPCARSLRFLNLRGCATVRSLAFAGKLPQLEYLCLESTGVADSELANLGRCYRLRYLSLRSCSDIRDLSSLCALPALLELNVSMTAVTGGPLSTSSGGSDGRRTPHGSSTLLSSTSSPTSARSASPSSSVGSLAPASPSATAAFRFPVLQLLHLNGCSRVARLEELPRFYPQLRAVYADRIAVMSPRGVGIGFTGMEERRRVGPSSRSRGLLHHVRSVSVNVDKSDGESSAEVNKSAMHIDQVLQQYVPQPPLAPRPRTAHVVASRPQPRPVRSPCGSEPTTKMQLVSVYRAGESARVLRLVLRRSSVTDCMLDQLCHTFTSVCCLDLTKCTELQCLAGVERLFALKELTLSQSSVDNGGVRAISACESLEVLRLTECRDITDIGCLGGLRRLRVLCVARTQLTNQGLAGISQCTSLQYLNCAECRYLSDVNALSSLKRLIELHLERTDVVDAGIRGVLRCSALQRVYLTRCQRLTTMGDWHAFLPQLEVLDVYGTSIPTRVAGQGQQFACNVM
ncbi:Leucine Rich repeat [Novymonas esmeraldas]|uniref:Leucine Rich repeat n=1 Tax=Novymonas esmeraldas TaxID=1808958 RepID=A0AAW0F1Y8_9TRYP